MEERKAKRERILDRTLGAALIIAGAIGVIVSFRSQNVCSNISYLWPILGLMGISMFVDSFLKKKVVKIVFNLTLIIALVVITLQLRSINGERKAECGALQQYELAPNE